MSIASNYNQQLSSGYYKLNLDSGTAGIAGSTGSSSSAATQSAAASSAFLLSLSPEAQDYLKSVGLNESVSPATSSSKFTLSDAQQAKLDGIIAKYKGQPFTQETFDKIQNDLQAAGLSPDQLAQQAQIKDFNPTSELIAALSGKDDSTADNNNKTDASKYDTQKNNYVQSISDAFEKVAAPVSA